MARNLDGSALTFPCRSPIKAPGKQETVLAEVRAAVVRYVPAADRLNLQTRASLGGRYLAVTVTILAHSRQQLDALYRELNARRAVDITL